MAAFVSKSRLRSFLSSCPPYLFRTDVTRLRLLSSNRRDNANDKHKDYYTVLELTPKATQSQIKASYKDLSFKWHPDRNRGNETEAQARFTDVNEAYNVLGNYDLRKNYDRRRNRHDLVHHSMHFDATTSKTDSAHQFDEFYRNHYYGALKRRQTTKKENRIRREARQRQTISEVDQKRLMVVIVVLVLALGLFMSDHKRKSSSYDQT
ncbi:chaperone protein DnaJ-like [Oscarella lobularis]|uniref:chaperone protein DnaJ-like n=1 Tax=Oscarella lobularis TaxID=121494 RepID=UPI0033138AD8